MELIGPYYTYNSTLWYPLLGGGLTQTIAHKGTVLGMFLSSAVGDVLSLNPEPSLTLNGLGFRVLGNSSP